MWHHRHKKSINLGFFLGEARRALGAGKTLGKAMEPLEMSQFYRRSLIKAK